MRLDSRGMSSRKELSPGEGTSSATRELLVPTVQAQMLEMARAMEQEMLGEQGKVIPLHTKRKRKEVEDGEGRQSITRTDIHPPPT